MNDPVTAYGRSVVTGATVAGRLVRLACERHLRDVEEGAKRGLTWRVDQALLGIAFFERFLVLPDVEPSDDGADALETDDDRELTGEPFLLSDFQKFIVGSLCGWFRANGTLRFRVFYGEMGKGAGKTPLIAGMGLRAMVLGGRGSQGYCAATHRDQARLLFLDAKNIVLASPALRRRIHTGEHNLAVLKTGAFLRPISSEGRGLDGKRVQFAAIDEVHEVQRVVVQKMRAGTKNRKNALVALITNSGFDKTSVCWSLHEYSRKVLEGSITNDAWFAYVCGLDVCDACREAGRHFPSCPACDQWNVEGAHWLKANPNLGVSVTWDYLRELVREAEGMPDQAAIVQRLNFCIWTEQRVGYFNMTAWAECAPFDESELRGRPCYGGLDLGQSDDLTAWVRIWELEDGRQAVKARFWVPESALQQYPDRPYAQWIKDGWLQPPTQGNTVDYRVVRDVIQADCEADGVRAVAYDKRFAEQLAQELQDAGIVMVNTPQGFHLTEAMRKVSARVKNRQQAHNGNPILTLMVSNVVARFGRHQEVRPDKDASKEKIDGAVALIMANDVIIQVPGNPGSIYASDDRADGVLVIDFS